MKKFITLLFTFLLLLNVCARACGPKWLEKAVFYQIYPSSYMDTDGNGIGDLRGIILKLDYIQSLGVNALWLNPIFESGWFDGGYDVIDFYKVDVDKQQELAAMFGIRSIPSLLFIPKKGDPDMKVGAMNRADLESAIKSVLLK